MAAKALGPTFGEEVIVAGLIGTAISWGATVDEIYNRDQLTEEQNVTLDGVIAAHDPATKEKNIITTSDFVARFTNQEYLALEKKRAADIAANKVGNAKTWDIVAAATDINMKQQKFQKLKTDLVADGILTQARADEIFDTPSIKESLL